jgi:hypothetical protein
MSTLNVDEANFHSERKVVEEEFRQRVLANPTAGCSRPSRPTATCSTRTSGR